MLNINPPNTSLLTEDAKEAVLDRIRVARAALGDSVVILGHHYQRDAVVDFADFMGDSFKLCKDGAQVDAQFIVFAGVHFMAESAAILGRADQRVILPDMNAGCSMADMANHKQVEQAWNEIYAVFGDTDPRIMPITYMNSTAAIKGFVGEHGGAVCTSSNARGILNWAFETHERVFFFPDQHLGRNTGKAMGIPLEQMVLWNPFKTNGGLTDEQIRHSKIILWDGYCGVHQQFKPEHIDMWREKHPDMNILSHPECTMAVIDKSDYVGSTGYIINMIEAAEPGSKWAIATEVHLVNRLKNAHPDKLIEYLAPTVCACVTMSRINPIKLAEVLEALLEGRVINEITVPEDVAKNAKLALDRMLAIPK